jgi:tetratricopeptide (TPR) repeat protein
MIGSSLAQAATLQGLLFEPQALTDTRPVHTNTLKSFDSAIPIARASNARQRTAAITTYAHKIATLQENLGPFANELATEYLALGRIYQEEADYDNALAMYAKAEHIIRINHGLYAPEQFLPIELGIDCHLANGAFPDALERQEYLVYLHRKHYGYDAVEVVPELLALGDMYFDAFERGIRQDPAAPVPALGFGPETDFADPRELSPIETAFKWLDRARTQYFTSITSLVARQDYTNPLLLDLETNLIETLFLQAFRRNIEVDPQYFLGADDPATRDTINFDRQNERIPLYRNGEEAFTRILAYLRANPAVKPAQVAEAMLQLGDWHMLFGKHKRGMAQYEDARNYLVASGASESDIAALLNPAVPVQLPVFMDQPHSRALVAPNADPVFDGFIDVALTLDDTGDVKKIEVLGRSESADPAVEDRLKKVLRNAPFRPRIAGTATTDKVALRYNFAQL